MYHIKMVLPSFILLLRLYTVCYITIRHGNHDKVEWIGIDILDKLEDLVCHITISNGSYETAEGSKRDLLEQFDECVHNHYTPKVIHILTYSPHSSRHRDGMDRKELGNSRQLKLKAVPKNCKENNHVS